MKVSKDVTANHREQIIKVAARRFRERGFDGISVADIMNEAGLTHGGFYRHFSSKDELIAISALRAVSETIAAVTEDTARTEASSAEMLATADALAARAADLRREVDGFLTDIRAA